jgi:hypothetical protein
VRKKLSGSCPQLRSKEKSVKDIAHAMITA